MTPARRRILLAGLATLMATGACDGSGGPLEEQGRLRRLAGLGIERFDSAAAFRLAGMSTHRQIQLDVLDPRKLGADTLDPTYHLLHMRCGSCHGVPAPSSKPAFLWEASLSRMKKNIADAGLMPMTPDDEAQVLRFLREHAADAP
jgi:hypothetical protein